MRPPFVIDAPACACGEKAPGEALLTWAIPLSKMRLLDLEEPLLECTAFRELPRGRFAQQGMMRLVLFERHDRSPRRVASLPQYYVRACRVDRNSGNVVVRDVSRTHGPGR